jgi:RNA polymerase-binding transcription factor DksA
LVIDLDDNAVEESSREILYSLYQVEKANLEKIEADIKELSSASFRDANP